MTAYWNVINQGFQKEAYGYLAGFTSEVPDFSGQDSEYPAVPWYDELETEYTEEFDGDIFSNLKSLLKTMKMRQSLKRGIGKK